MKDLMWGTCAIAVARKTNGSYSDWKALPTPVENSTTLTTTKGEKKEARVEGGGVEAVRYAPNSYSLASAFRMGMADGSPVTLPFDDNDGVVEGIYGLRLQPQNKEVVGMFVKEVVISVEEAYTAAEGATKTVTFDFLKPDTQADGKPEPTINWQVIPSLLAPVTTNGGN